MKIVDRKYIVPFCLVTLLFLLWGLANNMTVTLQSAFKRIMSMSDLQTTLIQFAFCGSYFCFAIPAALFIRRFSFKSGAVLGLALYAAGALMFMPAAKVGSYAFYLIAIYIMAGGCGVLETTANPYILLMGDKRTATQRLNIAQAFNPLGCIMGILMSQYFILSELSGATAADRAAMSHSELAALQAHELNAVTGTYTVLGIALLIILIIMLFVKMPEGHDNNRDSIIKTFKRLIHNGKYVFGVLAEFFYVGAQVSVWAFTIRLVMQESNILEAGAANVYLISIIGFSVARFLFTWLMKWYRPSALLMLASAAAMVLSLMVVLLGGTGLPCVLALIAISFFMSLMYPTIYGLALDDVQSDAKIGASGLIMAVLGGAVIAPVQGMVSDWADINTSYLVPMVCFAVILGYSASVTLRQRQ